MLFNSKKFRFDKWVAFFVWQSCYLENVCKWRIFPSRTYVKLVQRHRKPVHPRISLQKHQRSIIDKLYLLPNMWWFSSEDICSSTDDDQFSERFFAMEDICSKWYYDSLNDAPNYLQSIFKLSSSNDWAQNFQHWLPANHPKICRM